MKIQLLGTGGAEGIPALYADSPLSQLARAQGGRDVRTRSAGLINETLKVDFGPDTGTHIARHQLRPMDWEAIFFTHSHDDHLTPSELQYSLFPFTPHEFAPFTIYGNAEVIRKIEDRYPSWPFELVVSKSFEPIFHGDMTVIPIHAYHKLEEDAQNLIFDDGKVAFLYGTDTGIWREDTWEFLQGRKLDGLVIECTDGFARTSYFGHMDVTEMVSVVDRLRTMGTLGDGAPVVTTHHGHMGNASYAQLVDALTPHGITAGYDGIILEID